MVIRNFQRPTEKEDHILATFAMVIELEPH